MDKKNIIPEKSSKFINNFLFTTSDSDEYINRWVFLVHANHNRARMKASRPLETNWASTNPLKFMKDVPGAGAVHRLHEDPVFIIDKSLERIMHIYSNLPFLYGIHLEVFLMKNRLIILISIFVCVMFAGALLSQKILELNIPAQASVGDSFKITCKNSTSPGMAPAVTAASSDKIYILSDLTAICIGTGSATVSATCQGAKAEKVINIFATGRLNNSTTFPRIISNYYIFRDPGNRFRGVPHAMGDTVYLRVEGIAPFNIEIGNPAIIQAGGWFNGIKSTRPGLVEFIVAIKAMQTGETFIKVTDGKGLKYTVPHKVWKTRLDAPATLETNATMISSVKPSDKLAPCDNQSLIKLQK